MTATPSNDPAPWSSWLSLALLVLLALYTIIDRPLLSLQTQALRADLGLTDLQVGLIQGLSVALVTAVAGYPLGWLADRYDRRHILAVSIALWGLSMVGAGLAQSFEALFIASAFIGAGEASLIPIAYATMPELFSNKQRHLANSMLVVSGRLGTGFMIALCGWMIAGIDSARDLLPASWADLSTWRLVLLAGALPAFIFVPLILLLPRPAQQASQVAALTAGAMEPAAPFLKRHPKAFASLYAGMATMVFGISGVFAFAPVVAIRHMGASPLEAGNAMGLVTALATITGFVVAQFTPKWLNPRFGATTPVALLWCAPTLGCLAAASLLLADNRTVLFTAVGLMLTAIMSGTLLFPLVIQDMSPLALRTRLAAIAVTLNIVLGSLGAAAVGALSDRLGTDPRGLQIAMGSVATAALVVSSLLLLPLINRYAGVVADARSSRG